MIYLVESAEVAPEDLEAYLESFERLFLPPLREQGLELVGCWHAPADHGEAVGVTALLRARRRYVRRGTRRFQLPAAFSPLR